MDLLEHEVVILALLSRHRIPGDLLKFALHGLALERLHLKTVATDDRHLSRVQEGHLSGVFKNGGGVGGGIHLSPAPPAHDPPRRLPPAGGCKTYISG